MTVLFCFLTALFGILAGGVLARAAYALPRGEVQTVFAPRCAFCGRRLPLSCLIPILGSFLLAFRCPHCGEKWGAKIFASEVLFAAVCLLLYLAYGFSYLFFEYVVLAGVLLLLSLIDLDIQEVPHSLLLVILLLGVMTFVFSFFSFSLTGTKWWEHLIGAFIIALPLFLLMAFTGGVGGGDVKMTFCLGLLLAYRLTLVAFFFAIVLAALTAALLRLFFGKGSKYPVPLVPFLSLGAVLALLFGEKLLSALF